MLYDRRVQAFPDLANNRVWEERKEALGVSAHTES